MTEQDVEMSVGPDFKKVWFGTVPGTTTTICAITLTNDFTVLGQSACVNPAMFNGELGRKYAAEDAIRNIGPFIGWRMSDKAHAAFI